MKRLIIIVEGQTEEEFVNNSLRNYLANKEIYDVRAIKIRTSNVQKGGYKNYDHLRNDIQKILHEPNVIVSTFVDFFRIPTSSPAYQIMLTKSFTDDKIDVLENGMTNDINDKRFIPYIQKHEFEALLFSSNIGFSEMYDDAKIIDEMENTIANYDNPEEINDNPNTAPSKRIEKILKENGERYDKVLEGNLIAEEIGIEIILEKCPRFRNWVNNLITALGK